MEARAGSQAQAREAEHTTSHDPLVMSNCITTRTLVEHEYNIDHPPLKYGGIVSAGKRSVMLKFSPVL